MLASYWWLYYSVIYKCLFIFCRNVEADPFYDSNGNSAQPLFSSASNGLFNSEEFNDMLNKHSIVPEIGSRSQGIAT